MQRSSLILITAALLRFSTSASAQMVATQSPFQSTGTSFYESSHIGWSIHNPHYFMTFNGGGGAVPPFGGYQPNAGLHTGFAVGNAAFDLGFAQGTSITSTSATPVLTTTNGFPGYLFVGSERPFVTGVSPIVGGNGGGFASVPPMGPLQAKMATGQLRFDGNKVAAPILDGDGIPPAPIPRAEDSRTVDAKSKGASLTGAKYLDRATEAEQEGKVGVARIYYQLAVANGDAVVKAEATRKLDGLKRP